MGDEAEARVEEVCDAAGNGDFPRLDLALERLWVADMSPVAVIRGAMGHFQRLAQARESVGRGDNVDFVLKRLRVHFSRADSFKAQTRRWSEEKLGEALNLLLDAEVLAKTTAVPAEAVCGRTLMNVAAMARGRM